MPAIAVLPLLFFLMIRRPPRSTLDRSSAASDVYKRQILVPCSIRGGCYESDSVRTPDVSPVSRDGRGCRPAQSFLRCPWASQRRQGTPDRHRLDAGGGHPGNRNGIPAQGGAARSPE